jgi:hypothetical protein
MGQIDLDMALGNVWVNPHKYFLGLVKKDHIFIDDKVTVVVGQSSASSDDGLDIGLGFLSIVILLQLYYLLVL